MPPNQVFETFYSADALKNLPTKPNQRARIVSVIPSIVKSVPFKWFDAWLKVDLFFLKHINFWQDVKIYQRLRSWAFTFFDKIMKGKDGNIHPSCFCWHFSFFSNIESR